MVRRVSERLVARGHDVTVATSAVPERSCTGHNGVAIREFNISGRLNHSALGISGETEAFMRFLRSGKFDIVMNYAAQTWGTDLTCRLLGTLDAKTVLVACGFSGLLGWRRVLYWRYFQRLPMYLRRYDAVVYHAEGYIDERFGRAHGVNHYRVIPNGVDAAEFHKSAQDFRRKYGIRTRYLALSVGNHFRNKGHERVISAFRRLRRSDTTLVIIGRDVAPLYRSCWRRCRRAAGRDLVVLDGASRSDVSAAFAAADVFLSGSYIEAFPLVLLESMASRTPFVAFPAGNASQLAGGLVVNSTLEMAAAVHRLLDDTPLRMRLAEQGREQQAAKFEWETVVDQYEELYRSLLNSRRRKLGAA